MGFWKEAIADFGRIFRRRADRQREAIELRRRKVAALEKLERPFFECPDCGTDIAVAKHLDGCPRAKGSRR